MEGASGTRVVWKILLAPTAVAESEVVPAGLSDGALFSIDARQRVELRTTASPSSGRPITSPFLPVII